MQGKTTPLAQALSAVLYDKINAQLEREAFMAYAEACVTHGKDSEEAMVERAIWNVVFALAYRRDLAA